MGTGRAWGGIRRGQRRLPEGGEGLQRLGELQSPKQPATNHQASGTETLAEDVAQPAVEPGNRATEAAPHPGGVCVDRKHTQDCDGTLRPNDRTRLPIGDWR